MRIAIDFDGTIVEHRFPDIGEAVPGALFWIKKWQEAGADLILWTLRSDGHAKGNEDYGPVLTQAVEFCRANGIEFAGINEGPEPGGWRTSSPKVAAEVYVDDAAFGCPLVESKEMGCRPMVDWNVVGPALMERLTGE